MFSLIDEGVSHENVVRTPFAFGEGTLERVGDIGFLHEPGMKDTGE